MKVINKIRVYEVNDKETSVGDDTECIVESHWNYNNFVILCFNNERFTVSAEDLLCAIKNATNVRKW